MKTYQKTLAPVYAAVLLAMSATAVARVPGIGGNAANGATTAPPASCTWYDHAQFRADGAFGSYHAR